MTTAPLFCLCILLAFIGALTAPLQGTAASAAPDADSSVEDGLALAAELCSQRPRENLATRGTLMMRDAASQRTEIPIKFELILDTNGWHTLYETVPTNGMPPVKLLIQHFEHGTTQYSLATNASLASPASPPLVLGPASIWQLFAGSDFALADLGLEFFHWPQQKVAKTELRRGRRFTVLESRPAPGAAAYARVVSWIDPTTGGMLRADAYDKDGRLLKEFQVRSVKRGQLKEIQIRNFQTHSVTRLEFELESDVLPEDAG